MLLAQVNALKATDDSAVFSRKSNELLAAIQSCNEIQLAECKCTIELLNEKLKETTIMLTNAQAEKKKKHEEKDKQCCELATQQSSITSIHDQMEATSHEIQRLQDEIDNDQQRLKNAVEDITPIQGIYNAIVTGDAKRAIPFYSTIDGIISIASGQLLAERARLDRSKGELEELQSKSTNTENTIRNIEGTISRLDDDIVQFQKNIAEFDICIKRSGEEHTRYENIRLALSKVQTKYKYLLDEIDLACELEDRSSMSQCIQDMEQIVSICLNEQHYEACKDI